MQIRIDKEEERELYEAVLRKAKRAGFEFQPSFWLKIFLTKLWNLDLKEFLSKEKYKRRRPKPSRRQLQAGLKNITEWNKRR